MSNEKFVQLHNHSHYSLLDGMSSIKGMVSCAADMGYKSLALTDHGTCAGLYSFQKVCKEKGIKPILGMEGYICRDHTLKTKTDNNSENQNPNNHIILLAKNETGYKNLIYLSSFGNIQGFYYKPRIDFEVLESHRDGLIVSSACIAGEIPRLILNSKEEQAEQLAGKYKEVFKDDFYLEIMLHSYFTDKDQEDREKKIANIIYKMGKKLGIKVIATQDSHYTRKEDWVAHDVLLSIQTLANIKNPNRLTFGSDDFYLKPYEQMEQLFSKAPDVLLNTVEIAEKVEDGLIVPSQDLLPNFKLPEGFNTEEDYLKALVEQGMRAKGLINRKEYRDRIKMEMEVIIKCKYTKYFLILWDIVNFTREQNLKLGPGRGSAVSSLCLYVLDVIKVDPLKYDLIFERFLNPERISPPDVDLDFDYDRRDEVYDYIIRKYGADHCCQIGTYNKFKARAVIRSSAKALDIGNDWETYQGKIKKNPSVKPEMTKNSLNMADQISKSIPFKANMTIEMALKESNDFKEAMHKFPKLLEAARRIEGTISSAGVHPAGIIVCKDPVIERIPLRNAKGVICSQYDGPEVEKLGLLKFDLLALKTLTVVEKTVKMIKQKYPDKIAKDFDIDKLEPNDQKVFDMLSGIHPTKNTLGIFQFESSGISKLLQAIHVTRFEDMIVANALYRPGPLKAGMHDEYSNFKHGRKKVQYLHPKMEEALKDTYGILVYQESLMKISQTMAGFTGGQADMLRKAVGKKQKDLMAQTKKLFIDGCIKNNVSEDIAKKVFEQIEYFGDYGFNKCLSGDTLVLNKIDNKTYSLKELADGSYGIGEKHLIILDSLVDGKVVEDELVEVFETGKKEIYEVELSSGMKIKCTLDHKFYCADNRPHTLQEIIDEGLEILGGNRTISIKKIGREMTYNVTMKSDQHNYKIVNSCGSGIYTGNSHSCAYAYLAYQTAWLKYYFPLEFMCNLLTSEINNNDKNEKLEMYIAAAERMKIGCSDPHINQSGLEFQIGNIVKKNNVREVGLIKPLTFMKGVGDKAVMNIVKNQPYKNLEDFVKRTDARIVNIRVFASLVEAGCMKCWGVSKELLLKQYAEAKEKLIKGKKEQKKYDDAMSKLGGATLFDKFQSGSKIDV